MKQCPHCGVEIEDGARFCMHCMTSLVDKTSISAKMKYPRRLLTTLTALLLLLVFAFGISLLPFGGSVVPSSSDPSREDSVIHRSESSSFFSENYSNAVSSPQSILQSKSDGGFWDGIVDFFSPSQSLSISDSQSSTDSIFSSYSPSSSESSSNSSSSGSSSQSASSSRTPTEWDNWRLTTTPPAGFESLTLVTGGVSYFVIWRPGLSEYFLSAGLNVDKNVVWMGVTEKPSDNRYFIPETVNGYTIVGISGRSWRGPITLDGGVISTMREVYCPPSCRYFPAAFQYAHNLTDLYIAADSFGIKPSDFSDTDTKKITIHAKADAWCEYAGMTIAEYLSDPNNEYQCNFAEWDPSTLY